MKKKYSKREKELLNLSEEIGQSHKRIRQELELLDHLMWLLIYNAGENYSDELAKKIKANKENSTL